MARGLARHCPVCGGGGLFRRWLVPLDRCPTCGFRFERIEGHWIGSLGMNTIVSFGALLGALAIGFAVTYPDPPVGVLLVLAIAMAVVVPVAFFPWSRTLWSAIDLMMRPLGPDDEVDPRHWPAGRPPARRRSGRIDPRGPAGPR